MRFSGFIGVILAFGVLTGDILLAPEVFSFLYLPALLVCVFGAIGLSYLSYGAYDTLAAISAMRLLVVRPGAVADAGRRAEVLGGMTTHLYACGLIGSFISLIKMFAFAAAQGAFIFNASSTLVTLLPLFYAAVGAEFLLRPSARRMADLART